MKNLTRWLEKGLRNFEDAARILSIISMTLLVFIQVIARIFFAWSSPAMEEAARFIMIWSIFIGAVVTMRERGHIQMGAPFRSEKGKRWFSLVSETVSLIFLCIFVQLSYVYAIYSWTKGMSSIVLGVPLIIVHSCFLFTGVLMAIHTLLHLRESIGLVAKCYMGGQQ